MEYYITSNHGLVFIKYINNGKNIELTVFFLIHPGHHILMVAHN